VERVEKWTQDLSYSFLRILWRNPKQDEMRGTIRERNRDAPMGNQRDGKRGTRIEELSDFAAGIRSSVGDDPTRRGKKRKREANRLSQWSDRPQSDEVISVAVARIVGELLGAGMEDGYVWTGGELRDHLSEKQRPLTTGFEEHDVQIRAKDLKRDAREACSRTYVEKVEGLVGWKESQRG